MTRSRGPRALHRGVAPRLSGLVLGVGLAAGIVVALTAPLVGRPARVTLVAAPKSPAHTALAWPAQGSAALYVPSAGVAASHDDSPAPIASLTKMMTALVALGRLPLAPGSTGPCHVVDGPDVATYDEMTAINESSVVVTVGEQLCESDLIAGTLVHSAGNYAVMLAQMVAGTTLEFVALMNRRARAMGLGATHYADVTGFDPASISTASDQARVTAALMRYAVVRDLVDRSSVSLPVAGVVPSYTPFVGQGTVIGVKSGRTGPAGGCDAMAVTFRSGGATHIVYAVVLGQRTGDVLASAGTAALALADSALAARSTLTWRPGARLARVGFGEGAVVATVARTVTLSWWPRPGALSLRLVAARDLRFVRHGAVVAHLVISGAVHRVVPLVAARSLAPPSWFERLL